MKKRPLTRKDLEYYARMAAEAYVNDPVHSYATKNEKITFSYAYCDDGMPDGAFCLYDRRRGRDKLACRVGRKH